MHTVAAGTLEAMAHAGIERRHAGRRCIHSAVCGSTASYTQSTANVRAEEFAMPVGQTTRCIPTTSCQGNAEAKIPTTTTKRCVNSVTAPRLTQRATSGD